MSRKSLLLRFAYLALPLLVLLVVLHRLDRSWEEERWRAQMNNAVAQSLAGLAGGFHDAAADALALAADKDFRQGLRKNDFTCLASRFEALARFKPDYRQIRYLDETGMERLRVDSSPETGVIRILDTALQDKAGRDYFLEAVGLADRSVRLSRLDLNIEHGKIETPFNPMLRFSSPVFDADGKQRGVIVINLGVDRLLGRLERNTAPESGRLMLLNTRGSWLAGGGPTLRWGDILGNNNGFARERPMVWARLTKEAERQPSSWVSDGRLYARASLRPADVVHASLRGDAVSVSSADPWWMVLSEAEFAVVYAQPLARLKIAAVLAGLALSVWLFVLLGWQRLKRAAHAAEQLIRQLARVVEQTSDLVFVTDRKGHIEYVNPAFSQTTGFSKEETKGRNPSFLKSNHHPPEFYAGLWSEIRQGRQFRDLFINRRRDGSLYYEEKTISPLIDEDGLITNFVSIGKDITASKVTRLAFHDQLTGLVNRTVFLDRLQHELAQAARSGQSMAVLFMDLDGFKQVNDSAGHRAGDEILREFAKRVGKLIRKSDTFARLGGDEFAALLNNIGGVSEAETVAGKIIEAMVEKWEVEGQKFNLGVSIGIAMYAGGEMDSDTFLAQADSAMYDAKRGGRNRFVLFQALSDEGQNNNFPRK
ncbi:MAG: diguanylate cyclase [Desulfurivibrionaceae bacterium]